LLLATILGAFMYRLVDNLARGFALIGGFVLSALILLTCLSVFGRSINSFLHSDLLQNSLPNLAHWLLASGVGPVNGDFEIVEAGLAFTIFAFIPLCQLHSSHASVDIFTNTLSDSTNRILRAVIEAVFTVVLIIITVQLINGTFSKYSRGETTLLLQFPVWWGYALSCTAALASTVVAIYVAAMRIAGVVADKDMLPEQAGELH